MLPTEKLQGSLFLYFFTQNFILSSVIVKFFIYQILKMFTIFFLKLFVTGEGPGIFLVLNSLN